MEAEEEGEGEEDMQAEATLKSGGALRRRRRRRKSKKDLEVKLGEHVHAPTNITSREFSDGFSFTILTPALCTYIYISALMLCPP